MKPYAIKSVIASLLLLMAMAILAVGCYSGGPPPPEYPEYGYYGGYDPGFYGGDVIIGVGGHRERVGEPRGRVGGQPEASHMPARRLPAPAPRSRPVQHSEPMRR